MLIVHGTTAVTHLPVIERDRRIVSNWNGQTLYLARCGASHHVTSVWVPLECIVDAFPTCMACILER